MKIFRDVDTRVSDATPECTCKSTKGDRLDRLRPGPPQRCLLEGWCLEACPRPLLSLLCCFILLGTSSAPPQILPHAPNVCSSPPLHCETLPPPKCCLLLPLRTSTVVSPHPGFPFLPIPLPVSSCSEKIQNRKDHKQFLPFRCYSTPRCIGKSLSIPF